MHEIKISADKHPRLIWVRSEADRLPLATYNGGAFGTRGCQPYRLEAVCSGETITVFGTDAVTVERIGGGA